MQSFYMVPLELKQSNKQYSTQILAHPWSLQNYWQQSSYYTSWDILNTKVAYIHEGVLFNHKQWNSIIFSDWIDMLNEIGQILEHNYCTFVIFIESRWWQMLVMEFVCMHVHAVVWGPPLLLTTFILQTRSFYVALTLLNSLCRPD